MPPNDNADLLPERTRDDTTSRPSQTPPTFPPEAESLLRHLHLGAAQAATVAASNTEFPRIPNYEIECELGRGGMGVVYKARHVSLNRLVAIKMILASAHAAPGEVARFMAEAEAIAAVKHPNVVEVYDLGESNGRPYFVMEYVEGGNLAALLRKGGPLAPPTAAALIAAVATGVQAAHEKDIVHRDLKPANILLGNAECGMRNAESKSKATPSDSSNSAFRIPHSEMVPKVSDFGLAKRLASDLTRSQVVMGTPAYMAPEQAGGKAKFVGPGADVYALGVILYECLTGKPPFDAGDAWSLIRQVLEDSPEPLRKRVPGVPRDLELICLKCLEKEPHHRYLTPAALADDLHRFLRGEPVSVRPIGTATRVVRLAKRRPAFAALVALVGLLLVVVPPLVVWEQGRLDRRDEVAIEAEKARQAAERLAEARELFAIQTKLRNRAGDHLLGWTQATRAELPRAVQLAGDPEDVAELRSTAAGALLADDLFPLEPVAKGMQSSVLATNPQSGLIAVGEAKSWFPCNVLLIDPNTGETLRTLTFPTIPVKIGNGALEYAQDGTRALAFSPDGKRLFVGTRSSRVVRFDLDSRQDSPTLVWNAASRAVDELAVSTDSKTVYGVCKPEPRVLAWDADTGKARPAFTPPEPGAVRGVAVLPSGELIACNGQKLYRWSADGKLTRSEPNTAQRLTATNGSMLLLGNGSYLETADRDTLTATDRFTDPNVRRGSHDDSLRSIHLHPSGAIVATTAGDADRTVKVWTLGSGKLLGTVQASGTGPIGVTWSADGSCLWIASHGQVDRWQFAQPDAKRLVCVSAFAIETATFLPDGRVATLSESLNGRRELALGAVGGPSEITTLVDPDGSGRPGLSAEPGGTLAIARNVPGISRWKPGTPFPPLEKSKLGVWYPRFSRDGQTLWAVINAREVRAYDANTKAQRGVWDNSGAERTSGLATLESLAAGRTLAAAGGRDGSVFVLNATAQLIATFPAVGDPVLAVAVAPDDSLVVAGTQKGLLRVMNPATNTELAAVPAHPGGTTAVSISRDGTLLATGGRDCAVRLWKRNGDQFEPLLTVSRLCCAIRELQFSPTDGRLLVLLDHVHAARVWDIDRLKAQLAELKLGW